MVFCKVPTVGEVVSNAALSAASNALSMGMSMDASVMTGAKTVKQAFSFTSKNFVSSTVANGSGKIPKKFSSKLFNIGKNTISEFGSSIVFGGTMKYFETAITRYFGG